MSVVTMILHDFLYMSTIWGLSIKTYGTELNWIVMQKKLGTVWMSERETTARCKKNIIRLDDTIENFLNCRDKNDHFSVVRLCSKNSFLISIRETAQMVKRQRVNSAAPGLNPAISMKMRHAGACHKWLLVIKSLCKLAKVLQMLSGYGNWCHKSSCRRPKTWIPIII